MPSAFCIDTSGYLVAILFMDAVPGTQEEGYDRDYPDWHPWD